MSVSPTGSLEDVPLDHVRLVLILDPLFYLQIRLDEIDSLCLRPRKYLVFLGWCILGVEGGLAGGPDLPTMEDLDGTLNNQGSYYYITPQGVGTDLSHAIDLQVIKERSAIPSETTHTRDHFRDRLLERDSCCVFTGSIQEECEGIHIIPYKRGSEWFRRIIDNRPRYEENVENFIDINDIRNGVFVYQSIHTWFDLRRGVILKTPNHCLDMTDIPPRADRPIELPAAVTYPKDERYTLQWLDAPGPLTLMIAPNNVDATFKKYNRKPKPSALLLHYNYGAAAVKRWGHAVNVFETYPNPARPAAPASVPMGPSKTSHDRLVAINKRKPPQEPNEAGGTIVAAGDQPGRVMESRDQAQWDEDDFMLFFWGNSPAAKERYRKKQEERTKYMEKWRRGLPSIC